MAFPYPAADSLFPMDHLLSFDVSLTIPKNIRKMIYAAFSPITAYIRGYSLYSHVHRDVCIIQNCWTVPCLESDSYDSWPSICLEIARIRPFSITLESYIRNHWDIESIRENWEYRNYSPLLPELYLSLHPFVPLEHCCVLPKLAFVSELAIGVMEDWGGGGPSGGFSFSGSQTCRQRLSLVISDSY